MVSAIAEQELRLHISFRARNHAFCSKLLPSSDVVSSEF